ncbi:MAG TPA: metallophosphoesterase, partial [Methanoregulaceae archaeon]|nr:metallophosphoesterase [Methanoregulaceae archaeon]
MIIAVSDIHLGTESSNRSDFLSFLNSCDKEAIDHLVLLGDIMDFWRRNNAGVVAEKKNGEILDKIARLNAGKVHYVIGNHDYSLLKFSERYGDVYPFGITKSLRLEENGQPYYFIHG